MKKSNPFLFFAVLAVVVAQVFTGCQKNDLMANENNDMFGASVMKAKAKVNEADKAYDKAVREIMHNMMQAMNKMEMTCDPDIDFAMMMIIHHDAGIEMAEAELMYGHEPEAKELAEKTIASNQASKERLMAFLASHPTPEPLSKKECKAFTMEMDHAMHVMMQCMKKTDTYDVDVDFASQMICHHEGAIAMSRTELKWGNDEPALAEARMIIEEQSQEIIELAAFLNKHGIPVKKN